MLYPCSIENRMNDCNDRFPRSGLPYRTASSDESFSGETCTLARGGAAGVSTGSGSVEEVALDLDALLGSSTAAVGRQLDSRKTRLGAARYSS